MSLLTRVPARIGAATIAVVLAGSTIVALPAVAQAADPQVCVTAVGPTTATQPWYDFTHSQNLLWKSRAEFGDLLGEVNTEFAKLGPTSTMADVDNVSDAFNNKFQFWYNTLETRAGGQAEADAYALSASLQLIDPAAAMAAMDEIGSAFGTIVQPQVDALTDGDTAVLNVFFDTLFDNLTATFPLTGPVVVPSPVAAIAGLGVTAQAMDAWHDLGNAHVVLNPTPTTTCLTTATLNVPAAATTFGKATSVAITATKDAVAARGDLVVLLDGEQIGSGNQVSSYVATVPANLTAGAHVLTVAFSPVDGGPIATKSSTVTVAKAKTTASLKLSKAKVKPGKKVLATVTVAVPGTAVKANGVATIKVGKKTFKAKITNGTGKVSLGKPAAGSYSLKATYTGATSLAASTSSKVKLTVKK